MLYPSTPRIGLVIGTYAAVPHVHLQLESWKRHCNNVPCLVIDDMSPDAERLESLCSEYSAAFECNPRRMGHTAGDMNVFIRGAEWGRINGLDMVVKFSRRWIPLLDWQSDISQRAVDSQGPTFSARCLHHGFGFRSECVGMHVDTWCNPKVVGPILKKISEGHSDLVERDVHSCAGIAWEMHSEMTRSYDELNPPKPGCGSYVEWPFMGESRVSPRHNILWHEWARAHEYHRALFQWGVGRYRLQDFVDPQANIRNV